jgi:nitrate reductase assembly molybdenum cofactor insertion protein NarJ
MLISDHKQRALLAEAARWRLIGALFECPTGNWREILDALCTLESDPDLREATCAAQTEASESLYYSVFGPGGSSSPREVSYHKHLELGSLMSELGGYYDAFGYQPDTREPGDHIAVEAGFVGYLRLKEAYALACDDSGRAQITAEATQRFIENHLSAMAAPLADSLENSGIRYLALAARALADLCRTDPPQNLDTEPRSGGRTMAKAEQSEPLVRINERKSTGKAAGQ